MKLEDVDKIKAGVKMLFTLIVTIGVFGFTPENLPEGTQHIEQLFGGIMGAYFGITGIIQMVKANASKRKVDKAKYD